MQGFELLELACPWNVIRLKSIETILLGVRANKSTKGGQDQSVFDYSEQWNSTLSRKSPFARNKFPVQVGFVQVWNILLWLIRVFGRAETGAVDIQHDIKRGSVMCQIGLKADQLYIRERSVLPNIKSRFTDLPVDDAGIVMDQGAGGSAHQNLGIYLPVNDLVPHSAR